MLTQQKRTKSSIYEKVYGKYEGGKSMLYIEISDAFNANAASYKQQVLDGFYRFWKLRSGANGAGGNVDVKMTHGGKVVAAEHPAEHQVDLVVNKVVPFILKEDVYAGGEYAQLDQSIDDGGEAGTQEANDELQNPEPCEPRPR